MVLAGEQEQEGHKTKLFTFRGIFEGAGRHTKSLSVDTATELDPIEDGAASSRSQGSRPLTDSDKIPKARTVSKEEMAAKEAKEKLLQGQYHYYLTITLSFLVNSPLISKCLI